MALVREILEKGKLADKEFSFCYIDEKGEKVGLRRVKEADKKLKEVLDNKKGDIYLYAKEL